MGRPPHRLHGWPNALPAGQTPTSPGLGWARRGLALVVDLATVLRSEQTTIWRARHSDQLRVVGASPAPTTARCCDGHDHGSVEPPRTAGDQAELALGTDVDYCTLRRLQASIAVKRVTPRALRERPSASGSFSCCARPEGHHHAFSPVYDSKRSVTVAGVVTEFRFVNPHAMLSLEVNDALARPQSGR